MKKFFVRDADGEEYEVEEIKECNDEVVEYAKQLQFKREYLASRHLGKDAFYFDGSNAVDGNTRRNIPGARLGMDRKQLEAVLDKYFGVHDSVKDDDVIEEISETEEQPEALTEDEIKALKTLASVADKLVALTMDEDKTEDAEEDKEIVELGDEDEDEEEIEEIKEKKEEVVDTEEKKTHDSMKSFGAIEKKKTVIDSEIDTDIDNAWTKRYGGNK